MVFAMARPTKRSGSSNIQFRQRVPAEVRHAAQGRRVPISFAAATAGQPPISFHVTLGEFAKFSLHTREPSLAKERQALATTQLNRVYDALRNGPRPILNEERVALSGVLYHEIVEMMREEPGGHKIWQSLEQLHRANTSTAERQERWFGETVDELLLKHGIITDDNSRKALMREVARAHIEAAQRLQKIAEGDYGPDPNATRFPPLRVAAQPAAGRSRSEAALTLNELLGRWERERTPAPKTISSFKSAVRDFERHMGHDRVGKIVKRDVISWKDAMVVQGLSTKSINDAKLAPIKALLSYAAANALLDANPATGVRVLEKKRAGKTRLPYSGDEVGRILAQADAEAMPDRRWLPWLLATSGARIGELAQLWGQRIVRVGDIWVMQVRSAEDGGYLKNAVSERDVPLHPDLIERGFLDFVKSRGDGPLFYAGRNSKRRTSAARHASVGVSNRLSTWIRSIGFNDPRKAPSHAFRHWFKTACQKAGVLDSVADAIQGYAGGRGEADTYRHGELATLAKAVQQVRIPIVPVE
jgi:integrase